MKKKAIPDRRIQRTRQLLLDALIQLVVEKGYEATTVQDVIDRANVGRSTFYSHFRDKDDLLLSGFERLRDVFEGFQKHPASESAVWDLALTLFQHAEENRHVFKALFGKRAGTVVLDHVQKVLAAYLKGHFQAMFARKRPPVPLDVLVQYFVSVLLGLLTWWLDSGAAYSAAQMNDSFRKLTEPAVRALLGSQAPIEGQR